MLVEVLIAIGIGGILIAGATLAIISVLRSNYENRAAQSATLMATDQASKVASLAHEDWSAVDTLTHASDSHYFVVPRASSSVMVPGEEGVLFDDITAGLMGHWKLDEATGTVIYDSAGNGNNAFLEVPTPETGSVTRLDTCQVSDCIKFNGGGSLTVTDDTSIESEQFSTALWLRVTGSTSGANRVLKKEGSYEIVEVEDKQLSLNVTTGDVVVCNLPDALASGVWTHIALVYDGTYVRGYSNGVSVVECEQGGATANTANSFIVNNESTWNADMDDIRLYNRALSANEVKELYENEPYTRYLSLDHVDRDGCGLDAITTEATTTCTSVPAVGVARDPLTKKITSTVTWRDGRSVSVGRYIFRYKNKIFKQNRWEQVGQITAITEPNGGFASSSNITAAISSLTMTDTISEFPDNGTWLTSSPIDTQRTTGAAFHSIMWQGTKPNSTVVKFQIASSDSTSTLAFVGPDGTATTFYTPSSINQPIQINPLFHNNDRYVQFKIFLEHDGAGIAPTVNAVILGWSP